MLEGAEGLFDGDESSDGIREGGAAMTAYAQMQFTQMPDDERQRYCAALLRYCELDTLAMVFLFEYWQSVSATAE
jgi:succinate dehydrogenase flavin-adding protein (antitoxin of CptAB toxin-antitoxin module)